MTHPKALLTIGAIARQLNEPLHRVDYVIKTRDIRPVGVAGRCRVFDEDAVDQIANELQGIDTDRDALAARG